MRHKVKTDRFSRFSSFRKATIKSLVRALLLHQRIITTQAKAESARIVAEKLISLGKTNTLAARRRAYALLCDHNLVSMLFKDIAPLFEKRTGGYTRIIYYRNRRGDNAKLVILELTEIRKKKIPTQKPAKIEQKGTRQESEDKLIRAQQKDVLSTQEANIEDTSKAEERVSYDIKDTTKQQELKESMVAKPEEETKPHIVPEEHKHKFEEEKKPKKFLKGFKGFFKRERDSL